MLAAASAVARGRSATACLKMASSGPCSFSRTYLVRGRVGVRVRARVGVRVGVRVRG